MSVVENVSVCVCGRDQFMKGKKSKFFLTCSPIPASSYGFFNTQNKRSRARERQTMGIKKNNNKGKRQRETEE